jgi:hypothetical protein
MRTGPAAASSMPTVELTEDNAKNALQHWFITTHKSMPDYDTKPLMNGFISTITIAAPGRPGQKFTSEPRTQKTAAEKHVAFLALRWILDNTVYKIPPTI